LLRECLSGEGMGTALCDCAIHALEKVAGATSQHLYDRNRAVYEVLRYATIETQVSNTSDLLSLGVKAVCEKVATV
jgi:hypothetical protein